MTTPAKVNELNAAEDPARRLLERLGWTFVHRDALASERSERDVLLRGRLRRALGRLNPWLSESQAESVISALERVDETGMRRNQVIHEYLTYGLPFDDRSGGRRRTRTVHFFDFDAPQGGLNEFVVTTQFRVRSGSSAPSVRPGREDDDERMVIPDLVLFVNGIPLVVMEAKSPTLTEDWRTQAVKQLRRYQEADANWRGLGAPHLFDYNLLCVAHCGAAAFYGSMGAPENAYSEWKSMLPYSEDDVRRWGLGPRGQDQLIAGLLAPSTLLDVLRDYVVYEPDKGRLVKKLPRYQQYRAVRKSMERILAGGRPEERGGVVWHTQGSGKSLTMLWLAVKVRREPKLGGATILVVTDRTQLDRQIAATFQRCGFPAPEQAGSTRSLRRLLTTGVGRTVMTTVQKFEDALNAPQGDLDDLNAGENVIVMVDEAHRTQYGLLGARMAKALPNATYIGFTGTPIDKRERSTMRRFGPLIDAYPIPQAVADGATVPIHYEARLPELAVEGAATLDRLFEAMFSDETEEEREQIRRRYANRETVAEAEQRIQMIALDIADHFKAHVRPNGFKAQVVAPSRAAALRYAERLNSFGVSAYPIITLQHNDGVEFQAARNINQEQVVSAFLDPEGEPEALIVVNMLLTGFDAPVEQVLYLDRSMRDHELLQAIARVNRRFSHRWNGVETEKRYGLVMDYYGVSRNLEENLSSFEWDEVQETMRQMEEDPAAVVDDVAARAEAHFVGHDLGDPLACAMVFAPDATTEGDYKADVYERFNAHYRDFSQLMDRFLPDPRALDYVDRLARLTAIRAVARAQFLREDASVDWTDVGAKVKRLLDERIRAEVRELMKPVSVLDQDFAEKVAALPHVEARASVMEHAIKARIHERIDANPVFYSRLSALLEQIIKELRDQIIDAAEALKRMDDVHIKLGREEGIASLLGLSPLAFAIYGELDKSQAEIAPEVPVHDTANPYTPSIEEATKEVALQVESVIDRHRAIIEWQSNEDVLRQMRSDIKWSLRSNATYTEDELETLANDIVDIAKGRDHI